MASQDELRRGLLKRGFRVTQATLSRDIREIGLVKTADGYALPQDTASVEPPLPTVEHLMREFVREVHQAQNQVVLKTTAGSAAPVAAALDGEGWTDVIGTIAGDDTVLIICGDSKHARQVVDKIQEALA